ncbi:putative reverse transcriptase domain-containing protein [Tanacetum coccineum]
MNRRGPIRGLEEPKQAPPSPDYVPGPEHTDDEIIAKDQPGAEDASPTAQSPDYVPESDPEADPKEDDDEDPEEDPVDYPADGGDDGDDEEGSSKDDEDDDMNIEADDDEEEEHLALADFVVVALPATDQAPSTEETKPFETDESAATPPPHPAYCVTTRISIPAPVPTPLWSDAEVSRLLAISIPPSSPLSPWSSPVPQIPYPSLPLSLHHHPNSFPIAPPDTMQSIITTITTNLTCVRESSAADAARPARGLRDEIVETLQGAPVSTDTLLGEHVREFESMVRRDTDEIYTMLSDEQSQRQLLAGRVNMLFRDRRAHAHTHHLMETELRMSKEAWGRSMDPSDLAHAEVMSLRTTVHAQMSEITELQSADRSRQRAISDLLKTDRERREEMRELRAADRTRQQQIIQTLTVMQTLQRERFHFRDLGHLHSQGQVTSLTVDSDGIYRAGQHRHNNTTPTATHNTTSLVCPTPSYIGQGVSAALAARDANRNDIDNHTSGTGVRGSERVARECTYQDFMKCKPLYFKGTEGSGHFKKECPRLKNNKGNRGNQDGKDTAPAKVYAMGHVGTNPDSNVVTGTFLLNNRYASVLFDTGADRSFVSTAFSSQMDIMPSTLDHIMMSN